LNQEESQLVLRAQSGDQRAYEKLYRANVGKVYALCLRMCGCKDLAEDLTQDSFIRAWQKIDKFAGKSAFNSWLYRLTSNVVIGHLRKQSKWNMVNFDNSVHEQVLGSDELRTERRDLEKMLRALPDQARVILILYEYLGYKHNEIAELTGMAVGTSKSHLHRARELVKPNSSESRRGKKN